MVADLLCCAEMLGCHAAGRDLFPFCGFAGLGYSRLFSFKG